MLFATGASSVLLIVSVAATELDTALLAVTV